LGRRLGEPQSRSGHVGEEKNSQPLPGLEPDSSKMKREWKEVLLCEQSRLAFWVNKFTW